jgi:hypothetical protein
MFPAPPPPPTINTSISVTLVGTVHVPGPVAVKDCTVLGPSGTHFAPLKISLLLKSEFHLIAPSKGSEVAVSVPYLTITIPGPPAPPPCDCG